MLLSSSTHHEHSFGDPQVLSLCRLNGIAVVYGRRHLGEKLTPSFRLSFLTFYVAYVSYVAYVKTSTVTIRMESLIILFSLNIRCYTQAKTFVDKTDVFLLLFFYLFNWLFDHMDGERVVCCPLAATCCQCTFWF